MRLADPRSGIEALDRRACLALLATVPVGRFVAVVGGSPHIVPVNFAVDGESVVFRTDPGTTLRAAERSRTAFEADDWDAATRTGWSVVIHGEAEELAEPPAGTGARPDPWAGGEKAHWVRIRATTITGRRVS